MKIVDLFRRLSYGELSNLAVSDSGSGTIKTEKHPQMIQYMNAGLLALYSRFVLSEKSLLIEQVENITNYHLKPEYARSSNSDKPHKYIRDFPGSPFQGDVIKILEVYDEFQVRLPLNDQDNPYSLFTPRPSTLQIPAPRAGRPLWITYQACHRVLTDSGDEAINQLIDLPFTLETALQNYVAYKTYSHMNGADNVVKGQEYLAAYEAICGEILDRDLVSQSFHTSHDKLDQRGFV